MIKVPWDKIRARFPNNRENRSEFYKHFKGVDGYLLERVCSKVDYRYPKPDNAKKRVWLPSIAKVPLYSELMQKNYLVCTTADILHKIDSKGGLDNYLLKTRGDVMCSIWGAKMKKKLKQMMEIKMSPRHNLQLKVN